jgi:CubicO group peptidase (beta-lactamase class C family)
MRSRIGRTLTFFLLLMGLIFLVFIGESLPVISGYGAKVVCSGVFVAGRAKEDVVREDLASFPMSLASVTVDEKDSSVTASLWGMVKRKAIYRHGLGATLVSGVEEAEIRGQRAEIAALPAVDTDTVDWPMGERGAEEDVVVGASGGSSGSGSRVEAEGMRAAVGLAFGATGTRAVVVIHKGKIIAERYAPGFNRHTRLAGWSMTKGVMGALAGILVSQGKIDVREPAPVEEWKGDDRSRIRIGDLLHMSSGLSWWELYAGPGDATKMLFLEADMGRYAELSSLRHPPGEVFNYSSGTANILSSILRRRIDGADAQGRGGDGGYYRWPYEQLFYKIGMYSAVLEPDAGGTFVGSSYCYATARDWARFGLLYLWDGVWGGRRILPEGWVRYTRTGRGYGALWWLNDGERRYPGVPADCFSCEGFEGQYIWVIPSRDLVVVRMAMEHGPRLEVSAFLQAVIKALK